MSEFRTELAEFCDLVVEDEDFISFALVVDRVLVKMGQDCHFCFADADDEGFTEYDLDELLAELDSADFEE